MNEKRTFNSDVAFSPTVKAIQKRLGSRETYARMEEEGGWADRVNEDLEKFIAARDSFYFGTANAEGRPYIQHRGGPPGFLKVLDERTLAFADFAGNRQYITMGNLLDNNQAILFLMDYAHRKRVKIWGKAEVVENDLTLLERVSNAAYKGRPERAIVFHMEAWDSNCPSHITVRYTEAEVAAIVKSLGDRVLALEAENRALKERLGASIR